MSLEVPVPPDDRVTLAGLSRAVSPLEADAASETVPAKPFTETRVTVEAPEAPATILTVPGALVVKSCTVKMTLAEFAMPPLTPVTVTL